MVAGAQTLAKQVIAERQESMKARGAALRNIVLMIRGDRPWDPQTALQSATFVNEAAKKTPDLFPEGSGPARADTNALMVIWQDWPAFQSAAKKLEDASARLVQLAQADDRSGLGAQLQEIGNACAACHDKFRKPQ
jgi:cytochrome c556